MKNGFTLIEAILTLGVLAAGLLGVLMLYHQNVARSNEMEQTLVATMLAQEKLEQIIHDKEYQHYAFITPLNYPVTEELTSEGYPGYSRTITIQEVSDTDLATPRVGSGYKKVTVGVRIPGGDLIQLDTLVTLWGEAI